MINDIQLVQLNKENHQSDYTESTYPASDIIRHEADLSPEYGELPDEHFVSTDEIWRPQFIHFNYNVIDY